VWLIIQGNFVGCKDYKKLCLSRAINKNFLDLVSLDILFSNLQASSSNSSWGSIKSRFIEMGYSSTLVEIAIEECGMITPFSYSYAL
jgi:hypothetical protein